MLAITGGKGGCGKTTATLGLARTLAKEGRDPLVIDADTDLPDAHLLADVDREPTATAVARGTEPTAVCQHSPRFPGVSVLPAGDPESTVTALARAQSWHGPVLVDCPAGAGTDATAPLRESDHAILVTTATPQALSDTAKTAQMATRLDSPPAGTLVRGTVTPDELPYQCPHVERVPDIDGGPAPQQVLARPQFRAACRSMSKLITNEPLSGGV